MLSDEFLSFSWLRKITDWGLGLDPVCSLWTFVDHRPASREHRSWKRIPYFVYVEFVIPQTILHYHSFVRIRIILKLAFISVPFGSEVLNIAPVFFHLSLFTQITANKCFKSVETSRNISSQMSLKSSEKRDSELIHGTVPQLHL